MVAESLKNTVNSSPPDHPVLCIFFSQLKLSRILHYTLVQCFSSSASSTLSPSTTISLHTATQSSLFLRSLCPNHLNLPCCTTSNIHSIPTDLTNLHSFLYPSMSHHTSTLPSSFALSLISIYPPPSSPKSKRH